MTKPKPYTPTKGKILSTKRLLKKIMAEGFHGNPPMINSFNRSVILKLSGSRKGHKLFSRKKKLIN
jgi:hypothetical protein